METIETGMMIRAGDGKFVKGHATCPNWGFQKNNKLGKSNKGKKLSGESKIRLNKTAFLKGAIPWNKGKKLSMETRQKMVENHKGMTGRKLSGENKRKIGEANKGRKMSDEQKLKLSIAHTGKKASAETIKKRSGKNSSNWLGGKSFEPYSIDWTQTLRCSIRERDKYICRICGALQGDIIHNIHHIDYDKKNGNPDNLITLCRSCHSKTNINREYWQSFFIKS